MRTRPAAAKLLAFRRDERGGSALEFAIVAMPFILLLLALPQMAIYFMTQSSLDAGVIQAADTITNSYFGSVAPVTMTPSSLKSLVVSKSGGMIHNDATLSVELRKLSNLDLSVQAVGNTVDVTLPLDVVIIRAQATVPSIMPLMGGMSVRSAAILRRQSL